MDIPTKMIRFQCFLARLFRHHSFTLNTFCLEFKHFWVHIYRILKKVTRYRRSFVATGFASKSAKFWGNNCTPGPQKFRRPCLCILATQIGKFPKVCPQKATVRIQFLPFFWLFLYFVSIVVKSWASFQIQSVLKIEVV